MQYVIRDTKEWLDHVDECSLKHNQNKDYAVWGPGPKVYPCLAATTFIGGRFVTCFTYPSDAMKLISAECSREAETAPRIKMPDRYVEGHSPKEFEKGVLANLMAIRQELIDIRITDAKRYAENVQRCLAQVDQMYESDKEAARERLMESMYRRGNDCEGA